MNTLRKVLITGLGTGYLPIAPGTWGSAAAVAVFLATAALAGPTWQGVAVNAVMAGIVVVSSIICVALGPSAERIFGKKDPGQCTIDEWAGQALTFIALPIGVGGMDWLAAAVVGFLAFRLMDIVKPPPANKLQRLNAGWGILIDDLIAGVYANILTQVVLRAGGPMWLNLW